jgi:hypothetical protein
MILENVLILGPEAKLSYKFQSMIDNIGKRFKTVSLGIIPGDLSRKISFDDTSIKDKQLAKISTMSNGTLLATSYSHYGTEFMHLIRTGYVVVISEQLSNVREYITNTYRNEASLRIDPFIDSFYNDVFSYSSMYLFKNAKLIEAGQNVSVFEIDRGSKFGVQRMTEMAEVIMNPSKTDDELLLQYLNPFEKIDIQLYAPKFSNDMSSLSLEPVLDFDFANAIQNNSLSQPLSPVKASIAAAMLATGASGSSLSMTIDDDICLVKAAIVPEKSLELVSTNGTKTTNETFGWVSKMGVFNLNSKEFEIYE